MARPRSQFACQACGYRTPRWAGRCPGCGAWNTLVEERADTARAASGPGRGAAGPRAGWARAAPPRPITGLDGEPLRRFSSGFAELDRVLGGGVVPGSLVLVGGDPGIGKSTLLLQVASAVARTAGPVLYVSGEESVEQLRLRAERVGALVPGLYVAAEVDATAVAEAVEQVRPVLAVVDSIQTVYHPDLASAPGSVGQVRECAAFFLRLAKDTGTATVLVGHVTKGGEVAGPRTLEHATDAVLYFEGDRHHAFRVVRAVKNRFGSTHELGLFEMTDAGLREVPNPSEVLLDGRPAAASGSVVVATVEGTRPLLVEVQALLTPAAFGVPRRTVSGLDASRAALILAVLEKRVGLNLGGCDAYVKVSGGLRLDDPAADLGIALALASSFLERPVAASVVAVGEVGLAGEVRAVSRVDLRVREASRLGFSACVLPAAAARALAGKGLPGRVELIGVGSVAEALELVLGGRPAGAAGA